VASILKKRLHIAINGIVQGVGFRPYVFQLAHKYKLFGFILNDGKGVSIEVEGHKNVLKEFLAQLPLSLPPLARIDTFSYEYIKQQGTKEFVILDSQGVNINTMVSADISLCEACEKEMKDSHNRRFAYPFINCTNCGPRYTIIKSLPYDRNATTMEKFTMCKECQSEYDDPFNRRYHAQPISCFHCGPKLTMEIDTIVQNIQEGGVVSVKGVGGFHLVCDATNENAVTNLRKMKKRESKPLALMFDTIKHIHKYSNLSKAERALIATHERPIVLVRKRSITKLADNIAPNINKIGVLLAYTPLHKLLLEKLQTPLVVTSANISDTPIITDEKVLLQQFPNLQNAILSYDREIFNACDDSVCMQVGKQKIVLRLARGYTPQSFYRNTFSKKKILALGGHQKSTFALGFDNSMILSPHIGDLNSLDSFEYFLNSIKTYKRIYNFEPDVLVCDKHPNYETSKWAKKYVVEHPQVQLVEVQHHYAHALATMAEYSLEQKVLAFSFDGTGYGDDGSLWGGEVLLATPYNYARVYSFKQFSLLGGEKAVKEPRRVALSLLFESYTLEEVLALQHPLVESYTQQEIEALYIMYSKNINSPKSSSVGRLFDAVYAMSGDTDKLGYEGESGLIIEKRFAKSTTNRIYKYTLENKVIDYSVMIEEIMQEKSPAVIARKFINTLSAIIQEIAHEYNRIPIVLTGGVFQNKELLHLVMKAFDKAKIKYYVQEKTPINDGGIALGQLYYALHKKGYNG